MIIGARFKGMFKGVSFCVAVLLVAGALNGASGKYNLVSVSYREILISFDVTEELRIERVLLKKLKIRDIWSLEFREDSILIHKNDSIVPEVTLSEFVRILDTSLAILEEERTGTQIKRIYIHAKIVKDLWDVIVSSVRKEALGKEGTVEPKNREITASILKSVRNSRFFENTCMTVAQHGYSCFRSRPIVSHPVAFEAKYIGRQWGVLVDAPDAGLYRKTPIVINLEKRAD